MAKSYSNIWQMAGPNRSDVKFLAMTLIIGIIFILGYLQATSLQNFGTIYSDLTVLTFIFILIAVATGFKVMAWVIYGATQTQKKLLQDIAIGIIAIAIIMLINNAGTFSISVPLSISPSQVGNTTLTTYAVLSFYGPIIEELFWIGVMFASLRLYHSKSNPELFTAGFLIVGLLIMFLGSDYLGIQGIIVGGFLIALGVLASFKKIYKPLGALHYNNAAVDMGIAIFLILILHIYSYGNLSQNITVYESAGIFFAIEGIIDYYRGSIVPSIIMHSANNAVIGAAALGIAPVGILGFSIPVYLIMVGITIAFIIVVFRIRWDGGLKLHNQVTPYNYIVKGGGY